MWGLPTVTCTRSIRLLQVMLGERRACHMVLRVPSLSNYAPILSFHYHLISAYINVLGNFMSSLLGLLSTKFDME